MGQTTNWVQRAECRSTDPADFDLPDPDEITDHARRRIKHVIANNCDRCWVRVECLTDALTEGASGIRGGQLLPATHGTLAGFNQHRRHNQKACEYCREAKNDYYREYRRRRQQAAA